jgi:hypothetical protein
MTTYTWEIESTDADQGTMVIMYTHAEKQTRLNLPVPDASVDVAEWVDKFAPRSQWETRSIDHIVVGAAGEKAVEIPAVPAPAAVTPNVSGSVNEEYLRALIFQVLEEIKAAQV